MRQYLIIYNDEVYMQDAESSDSALDLLSADLQVPRDELVFECSALESERRQFENGVVN